MDSQPKPVIDYQSPHGAGDIPFLPQMMCWRSRCGWFAAVICLLTGVAVILPTLLVAVAVAGTLVWLVCFAGMAACAILTLIYMGKAASAEVSSGYAARQVALAVILMPVFMLGIFLLPILVQSDLMKWRRVDEPTK